ncbi:MAG: histidine phosphatase family protein [Bacteroidia bacterium]
MSESKIIYIIRHGETDFNKLGIVQGSGVDKELNDLGKLQAQRFFDYYKDIKFDHIYTSNLIRTQQSVLPFIERGQKYTKMQELNEISWGIFEGKQQSSEERAVYWEVVNAWRAGNYSARITNGESARDMQNRQIPGIQKIMSNTHEKCILICMHGRAMKSFLCTLLNEPLSKMEEFEHSNLGLYLLEKNENGFKLIKRNDRSHFGDLI